MFNDRKRRLETAEFAWLVECCRRAFRTANTPGDPLSSETAVDWDVFLALARRHRVQGLVWRSLHPAQADLPEAIAEAFRTDARTIAKNGMAEAAESARLLDLMSSFGVTVMFVKGLTLGRLAFGDPFVKMAWDIDILIPDDQLAHAAARLAGAGYELVVPPPCDAAGLQRWHGCRKESVWRKRSTDVHVELHTRLADNRLLLPGVTARSLRQMVTVAPGVTLPTLAADELFAYLCVHGASSAWFRLKWLADLAALLDGCSPAQVTRLYRNSQELGAHRAAGQGLLLARNLFATRLDPALALELDSDPVIRWLTRIALRQIALPVEPTAQRFGTATIHWSQLLLRRDMRFKISELRRQLDDAVGNRA